MKYQRMEDLEKRYQKHHDFSYISWINLPKLKKVGSGNNEPVKIKLPKLKKMEV